MREARELRRLGNLLEAEERLLEAIAIGDHHGPPGQRATTAFYQLNQIGDYYEARDLRDDILRLGPTLILLGSQVLGPDDPLVQGHREALFQAVVAGGDEAATQSVLEDAVATSRGAERARYRLTLAQHSLSGTDPDEAEPVLTSLLEEDPGDGTQPELRIAALQLLAELRVIQLREAEAEVLLRQAVEEASTRAPSSVLEARAKKELAAFYVEQDQGESADSLAREALATAEAHADSTVLQVEILDTLASSLSRQERNEEAEETYRRGVDIADGQTGPTVDALKRHYADWLRSRGRGDEAERGGAPGDSDRVFHPGARRLNPGGAFRVAASGPSRPLRGTARGGRSHSGRRPGLPLGDRERGRGRLARGPARLRVTPRSTTRRLGDPDGPGARGTPG